MPTNQGYVSIEKCTQIFVSGTESARTESEEKVILISGTNRDNEVKEFFNAV